ncbi:hypothetical protein [Bradyrhizobium sp. Leo170]|uniref:hypothetical protein n=1 Tax=Bradyrhizobium sp. Leo170 TaxID=1571199 RepID=UPI001FDF49B4|nr:hypothetical protein [Bradyrhizobium sp. Leo170]
MAPVGGKLRQRLPRPRMGDCGRALPGHRHDLFGAGAIAAADACTNSDPTPGGESNAEPKSDADPVADSRHG